MSKSYSKNNSRPVPAWKVWGPLALSLLLFWLILVEGIVDGLWFAVPVVAVALLVRKIMPIPLSLRNINLVNLLKFIPYFLWQSLLGGVDVAWRSFHPRLPIFPHMYAYTFRLHSEGARVFMAQAISLMPGTLACLVGDHRLIVHVLSGSREKFMAETALLEKRTASIFREKLEANHG